jgi:hypothetical protein
MGYQFTQPPVFFPQFFNFVLSFNLAFRQRPSAIAVSSESTPHNRSPVRDQQRESAVKLSAEYEAQIWDNGTGVR